MEPKQAKLGESTSKVETIARESVNTTLAQIYEIAQSTVRNVIDSKNPKMSLVLETGKISWNKWTRDFKRALVERLFLECGLKTKGSRPTLQHVQAVREILAEKYPALFGFGVLYDSN